MPTFPPSSIAFVRLIPLRPNSGAVNLSICTSRGVKNVFRCSLTPRPPPTSKRAVSFSLLSLSSLASAVTGAPTLIPWTVVFSAVASVTEVPAALAGVAAILTAAIFDLAAVNAGVKIWDSGPLPFLLYTLGATATAIYEVWENENVQNGIESNEGAEVGQLENEPEDRNAEELASWDIEMKRRDDKEAS